LVLVRWGVAVALLGLAISLTVRYGPMTELPTRWVTLGAALSVGSWVIMSVAFGAYLTGVASYASIYGSLAVLMVLFSYVYLSTGPSCLGPKWTRLCARRLRRMRVVEIAAHGSRLYGCICLNR